MAHDAARETYAAREKYDAPGRARRYARRSARRDEEEWRLLERALVTIAPPPADVLDVPCGTGRITERLLARGLPTRAGDLSPAMRAEAESRLAGQRGLLGIVPVDLDETPPLELRADLVVCFRFLHHLPGVGARRRVLESLAALARRDVLLSFNHPVSAHNLTRRLKGLLTGRVSDRYTVSPRRLRREAGAAGLDLVTTYALAAWRREFWIAHLRPREGHGEGGVP